MTTSGLLALGAAEIVDRKTQELLGYVYSVAHGQGQLQRWLLFQNPKNEFEIRTPSETMARWTLEEWQKHVPELWRANAYYVWAQADVYEYGGTYAGLTWKQIPTAGNLPEASFPDLPGADFQLDYMDGRLIELLQGDDRGFAYVVRGLSDESSIEYWLLPARFEPAGKARTAVSMGNDNAGSLDGFVERCQSSWSSEATFIITGCLNYTGKAAPFAP